MLLEPARNIAEMNDSLTELGQPLYDGEQTDQSLPA